jgi:formylglycine-generating enzyme required for sulfatase activity
MKTKTSIVLGVFGLLIIASCSHIFDESHGGEQLEASEKPDGSTNVFSNTTSDIGFDIVDIDIGDDIVDLRDSKAQPDKYSERAAKRNDHKTTDKNNRPETTQSGSTNTSSDTDSPNPADTLASSPTKKATTRDTDETMSEIISSDTVTEEWPPTETTCECSSGACCDGCFIKDSSIQCGMEAESSERRCGSKKCGADIEFRELFRYCDGQTADCGEDNLVWSQWQNSEQCTSDSLCRQTMKSATCEKCPGGCLEGQCQPECECSSGACCDGCFIKDSSIQCGMEAESSERRCGSKKCGADIEFRELFRYCDGQTADCGEDNLVWSQWQNSEQCTSDSLCRQTMKSATCEKCPGGCLEGQCQPECECSSGACCDGCFIKDSSIQCGMEAESSERRCGSKKCGADIEFRELFRYCDGQTADCGEDNLMWSQWQTSISCDKNALCVESLEDVSCKPCFDGCSGSVCVNDRLTLDAGYGETCVVRKDGKMICWPGSYSESDVGTASLGSYHGCALRNDRSIYCWGSWTIGGLATPPSWIDPLDSISAGGQLSCGMSGNSVYCWGTQSELEIPSGRYKTVSAGEEHACGLKTDGSIECWGNCPHNETIPISGPGDGYRKISAGVHHTCAINSMHNIECWGRSGYGMMRPPSGEYSNLSVGYNHACAIRSSGRTIECWGSNYWGQATSPRDSGFVSVAAGRDHTCGLKSDQSIVCWGKSSGGLLQAGSNSSCEMEQYTGYVKCTTRYPFQDTGTGATDPVNSGVVWVTIPGGSYMMGRNTWSNDKPIHEVTIPEYEMTQTEVTVSQYRKCVAAGACTEPSTVYSKCNWNEYGHDDHPVNCLDWSQSATFCEWIGGRLPSESEWEYAARSGGIYDFHPWGAEPATCEYAVMNDGGSGCGTYRTMPVCSKPQGNTKQGLCDMLGNCLEWVEDWYHDNYEGAPTDGSAWRAPTGSERVARGGCFHSYQHVTHASNRDYYSPSSLRQDLGFRCARTP